MTERAAINLVTGEVHPDWLPEEIQRKGGLRPGTKWLDEVSLEEIASRVADLYLLCERLADALLLASASIDQDPDAQDVEVVREQVRAALTDFDDRTRV